MLNLGVEPLAITVEIFLHPMALAVTTSHQEQVGDHSLEARWTTLPCRLLPHLARDLPRSYAHPMFSPLIPSSGPHFWLPMPPLHSSSSFSQHLGVATELPVIVVVLEKRPLLASLPEPTALPVTSFSLALLPALPSPAALLGLSRIHRKPPTRLQSKATHPQTCPKADRSLPGWRRGWHIAPGHKSSRNSALGRMASSGRCLTSWGWLSRRTRRL